MNELIETIFGEHAELLSVTQKACAMGLSSLISAGVESLQSGKKLIFFGNGGSASDAQHLATELVVRFDIVRPAFAAIALNTDTSVITAIGNDFAFDEIFARQIDAIANPGDLIIAISTSGASTNILKALQASKTKGIQTSALLGKGGGPAKHLVDIPIIVPSDCTARIQEMHILLGHALCKGIEKTLLSS